MKSWAWLTSSVALAVAVSAAAQTGNNEEMMALASQKIDIDHEIFKHYGIEPVEITRDFDPAWKREVRMLAYPLDEFVRKAVEDFDKKLAEDAELMAYSFTGYAPILPLEHTQWGTGYIAFQEVGRPADDPWPAFMEGKVERENIGFYMVWTDGYYPERVEPWGLETLYVLPYAAKYRDALPDEQDERAMAGFEVFKTYCIECHSMNLAGGATAPELNLPMNVLEFRDPGTTREYIANRPKFRARSTMPDYSETLSEEQLSDLMYYLSAMQAHKRNLDRI